MTDATGTAELRPLQVETNGINVIAENERKGHPHDLFWPWFAANVSVLGISYGSFVLGFGISFWQAAIVGVVGIVLSFLACGFIAVAGKRGSAPTMVLSRAAFGVNGNKLPALVSWVLTVGWETPTFWMSHTDASPVWFAATRENRRSRTGSASALNMPAIRSASAAESSAAPSGGQGNTSDSPMSSVGIVMN